MDKSTRDAQTALRIAVLNTDIQGSVRLWEAAGAEFEWALRRYDEIVRGSADAHRGNVYKFLGDGFLVVFTDAADAIQCAVEIQQSVQAAQWPSAVGEVRTRIAVATGEVVRFGDELIGPTLNHVARVAGAGYGGQTLVTESAALEARDALAGKVVLHEIGLHQLRDVPHAVRLYLALPVAQRVPDYIPIRALTTLPTNLRAEVDEFVGREREMEEVRGLLLERGARLITIRGPGGVGKTHFLSRLGASLLDVYEDGVWLVDLGEIVESERVAPAIASALQITIPGAGDPVDSLVGAIGTRHMVLLLDNYEQLTSAADIPLRIVAGCRNVVCMVTSRERLRVPGERVYELRPLPLPDSWAPLEAQVDVDSVRLFLLRAAAAGWADEMPPHELATAAEICRRLHGLPLAIELAAARLSHMTPDELLDSLGHPLDALETDMRGVPDRHRSMRAAIEWSYKPLPPAEAEVLASVAIFRAGFFRDAAEAVSDAPSHVHAALNSLRDRSFLESDNLHGHTRYAMLHPVRDFALEKLGDRYQDRLARAAHHFGAVVPGLSIGTSLADLQLASAEFENVQMTLDWAMEHTDGEMLCGIMLAMYPLFHMRNAFDQCTLWLDAAVKACPPASGPKAVARLLIALAVTRKLRGDTQGAWNALTECEAVCEGNDVGTTCLLQMLERGALLLHVGDRAGAEEAFRRTLAEYEKTSETWWVAECLRALARIACDTGRLDEAARHLDRALTLEQVPLQSWGVSNTLFEVGCLRRAQGNPDGAAEAFADSVRLRREMSDNSGLVSGLVALAEAYLETGRTEPACLACKEALVLARRHALDQVGLVTELLRRC